MEESIKKKIKRIVKLIAKIIGFSILALIIFVISFLSYERNVQRRLPQIAEKFYTKYEQELNDFVSLCFDNNIIFIGEYEKRFREEKHLIIMDGYYIYSYEDLSSEIKEKLIKINKIMKENHISTVYVDDNHKYVGLVMSRFLGGVTIQYYCEPLLIEKIKKDNYTNNAWYVDENWVIIGND